MASRKTGYVLTGFILGIIGFILSLAGFSTPYWMEPFDQNEGFKEIDNLGLWQYCLSGYTAWRPGKGQEDLDILGKRYTGCKWVFHREVEFIRGELCPWWFQLTQSLISLGLTGSLFIAIAAMVLLCMNMCNQYPTQREALAYFVLAIISSAAGYFCAAGVLVFGHFSDTPEWAVKNPAYFHLSWSYAFSTFSGAFNIFSGMFLMLAYMQVKSMMKATRPNYKPTLELATLTPTRKY